MRARLSELTPARLGAAVLRRIADIPHIVAWHGNAVQTANNRERLRAFRDRHRGRRCFVIANGPSIARMDLTSLRHEFTIAMNRAYLLFDAWGFIPTYYACINELVLEQFATDIAGLSMPRFLNWNRRALFDRHNDTVLFVRTALGINDYFGADLTQTIASGGTVTFACLQIAYYLGFDDVILIGLDHSFVEKGVPNTIAVRTSDHDESHCHPQYFPRGIKWQLPDLLRSEEAYALARVAFTRDGRRVRDATVGGKCDVFEKVSFGSLDLVR